MLDDSVPIDRVRNGAANFDVLQRFVSRAQHQKNRPQPLYLLHSQTRIGFQSRYFVGWNIADEIGLAGLERGDARGVFLDGLVNDFLDLWNWSPVALIASNDELAASFPAGKFKRTRTDRTIVRFAHFFRGGLLHDHTAIDVLKGVGIRLFERQDYRVIVGSFHFSDVLQVGRLQTLFIGKNASERRDHVFASERRTVVKANTLAQLELQPRPLHLPGFRQHAAVAALFVVGIDQRFHDGAPSSLERGSVYRVWIQGID